MNILIVGVMLSTIAQLYFCKLSLWWLICLVTRVMFCTRIMGITIKVKKLAVAEGVSLVCMFLWNMLFSLKSFPWFELFMMLLFVVLTVGLEFLDELLYVYVVEDLETEDAN